MRETTETPHTINAVKECGYHMIEGKKCPRDSSSTMVLGSGGRWWDGASCWSRRWRRGRRAIFGKLRSCFEYSTQLSPLLQVFIIVGRDDGLQDANFHRLEGRHSIQPVSQAFVSIGECPEDQFDLFGATRDIVQGVVGIFD